MTRSGRIGLAAALLILVVGAWATWFTHRRSESIPIGTTIPDVSLTSLQGGTVHLSQFRGHPFIIHFFTTWCGPCQTEAPDLQKVAASFAGNVNVVMVDRGETPERVRTFISQYGVHSPTVLLDPGDVWASRFLVTGQPETLVIDAAGVVRVHVNHQLTRSEMETLFRQAVNDGATVRYQSKSSG